MTSSGAYTFQLSDTSVVVEAFDRIGIRPPALTRHHLASARISTNLALQRFSTRGGVNLWKMVNQTINLVAGQATYTLPANLVNLTEVYFTTVNGNGAGYNNDRIMLPITRTEYAMLPNKLQPGQPTQYWFQKLIIPQVTLWQPPFAGAPAYVLNWWGLIQIQDANLGGAETPDLVYRAQDALCADLAYRLAVKFAPEMQVARKADAKEAWDDFASDDQEAGPMIMQPNIAPYGRMRR